MKQIRNLPYVRTKDPRLHEALSDVQEALKEIAEFQSKQTQAQQVASQQPTAAPSTSGGGAGSSGGGGGGAGTVTNTSGALTADQPMFGAGGADSKVGTKTGNTNNVATAVAGAKTAGNYPKWDASGNLTDGDVPAGGGDVVGPAGATDGHLAVFDGATGKLLKDGGPVPAGGSFCGAYAYNTGTQSLPNSDTALTFDTNVWDTSSIHSTVTNPTRFTAPSDGYYLLMAGVELNNGTNATYANIQLRVNGSRPTGSAIVSAMGSAGNLAFHLSQTLYLTAGQYVEFTIYSNPGRSATANSAWGQMVKMG